MRFNFRLIAVLLFAFNQLFAAPRVPLPPWPQAALQVFGFDAGYARVPWRNLALNEDAAVTPESWNGYALSREGFVPAPVIVPVRASEKKFNVAPASGMIRFWFAPNWATATKTSGGRGPGHAARLLELVSVTGKKAQTRWSLFLNDAGDTISLAGETKLGAAVLFNVPVEFTAGQWRMLTLCYSETNTLLLLDNEVIAKGEGLAAPLAWEEKDLGLVIGSDVLASADSMVEGQFEELTTFAQWPKKSDGQEFYYRAMQRRSLLGPVGTSKEEQEKVVALKAAGLLPEDYGAMAKSGGGGEGDGPIVLYSYAAGYLWLELLSVTNAQAHLIVWGTTPDVAYEILTKEALTNAAWAGEQVILGAAGQDWTPTTVSIGTRTNNLFFWARTLVDTDGDGLPDWWEQEHGLDPNDPDTGDTGISDGYKDGEPDGWTNLQEYQNGTSSGQFDTPAAPQWFVVVTDASGTHAKLFWSPASGPVTGYTIERGSDNSTVSVSSSSSSYVDTAATLPTGLYDQYYIPEYRMRVNYAGGSSSWSEWKDVAELSSPEVTFIPGSGGVNYLLVSDLPDSAASVRLGNATASAGVYTPVSSLDIPIGQFTNGVAVLPAAYLQTVTNLPFAQIILTNTAAGAVQVFYLNMDMIKPFWDGRAQLKDNLRFNLRAATLEYPIRFLLDDGSPVFFYNDEYTVNPDAYAYASYFDSRKYDAVGALGESHLLPFQENYLYRNLVFDSSHVEPAGHLGTGVYWHQSYGLSVGVPGLYHFQPPAQPTGIASVLTTNETRWLAWGDYQPDILYLPGSDLGVTANASGNDLVYSMATGVRNLFGLEYQSIKLAGADPLQIATLQPGAGVTLPPNVYLNGLFYPEVAQPQFQLVDYYFGKIVGTDDPIATPSMPGQAAFDQTNTTPLFLTSVGDTNFRLYGYAKLAVTNSSYSGVYGYLGQYFDRAYTTTNGVMTTNETGILSPYGEFFPTEPGRTALITLPDLETGERGTAIVHVVKLQLDVNHDGVMDLSFAGPDNTSPTKPFTFWLNNDYDRARAWADGHIDPDDDYPLASLQGLFIVVPDSEYSTYEFTLFGTTPKVRHIPCLRDLEDFARLWISGVTTNLISSLPAGAVVELSWGDKGNPNPNNPTIDLFKAHTNEFIAPYGSAAYLTNISVAQLQTNHFLYVTNLGPGDSIEGSVADFLGMQRLIWCGVKPGSGKLTLTFKQGTNLLAETSAYIEIKDIKAMYERWTVGDIPNTSMAPTNKPYLATEDLPVGTPPFRYPLSGNTNTPYILLVHDYDLPTWKKDRYAETAFKRLYWQGYEGRIGLFRWPGVPDSDRPLDDSEFNAWRSGAGLLNLLTNLNAQYPNTVYLMAHGHGAIAAGEALRLAGTNEPVNTYIAMQGTVPVHAYDPSWPWRTLATGTDDGTPNRYLWYYTNGAPTYFSDVGGAITYINYFNTNDNVLTNDWRDTQDTKPDFGYSWDGTNFFKGFWPFKELQTFPYDRYRIFSYCDEARSEAIGAQPNLGGPFSIADEINLSTLAFPIPGGVRDHSIQFKFSCPETWAFWREVLISMRLKPE